MRIEFLHDWLKFLQEILVQFVYLFDVAEEKLMHLLVVDKFLRRFKHLIDDVFQVFTVGLLRFDQLHRDVGFLLVPFQQLAVFPPDHYAFQIFLDEDGRTDLLLCCLFELHLYSLLGLYHDTFMIDIRWINEYLAQISFPLWAWHPTRFYPMLACRAASDWTWRRKR